MNVSGVLTNENNFAHPAVQSSDIGRRVVCSIQSRQSYGENCGMWKNKVKTLKWNNFL